MRRWGVCANLRDLIEPPSEGAACFEEDSVVRAEDANLQQMILAYMDRMPERYPLAMLFLRQSNFIL